jgi:Carboxypeptidase regulatory-like domain
MGHWIALWLLASALTGVPQWRLVYQDSSVGAVIGDPRVSPADVARLRSAWVWTAGRAPRQVAPAEMARAAGAALQADPRQLVVQVVRGGRRAPPDLGVIAAPIDMWKEVPEGSLPRWQVPPNGRLVLPVDGVHRWRLRVAGAGEGSWWMDAPPHAAQVTLASVPAAGLDVAVVDERGHPVAPVGGSLLEAATAGDQRLWASLRGGDHLAAAGLPDGREITLGVFQPGYEPAVVRGWPSALPRFVQLSRGAALTGRVTDAAGRPLTGVAVDVETWARQGVSQLMRYHATTGAGGEWAVTGVPRGQVALSMHKAGYVPLVEQLPVAAGSHDVGRRTLAHGGHLTVLVQDAGGPVAGARVEAAPGIAAVTDGAGAAVLDGLPQAPIALVGSAARHQPARSRLNPPFPARAVLMLPRAFTVSGRFVDGGAMPVASGQLRVDLPGCHRHEHLDDDGRFTVDLAPGAPADLVLSGAQVRILRTTVAAGSAGELRDLGDLQAPPGIDVTGRVVSAAGSSPALAPVAGARVWLPRPGPGGPVMAWANGDLLETGTGDDGRFLLAGLQQGAARLRIDAAGFARAQVDVAPQDPAADGTIDLGDLTVSAGTRLHVLVRPSGRTADDDLEGATARVDLGNQWLDPDMLQADVRGGEAVVPNVPAGPATVSVIAANKLVCDKQVTVADGAGDMDVDCGKKAIAVQGMVKFGGVSGGAGTLIWKSTDAGLAPGDAQIDSLDSPAGLRQQQVYGLGRPQVDVAVDEAGTFQTQDLAPGTWSASWSPRGGTLYGSITAVLPDTDSFSLDLLFPGFALSGVVVGKDGKPAAGARVRELTSGDLTTSGDDGTFILGGLPPGTATLQAQQGSLSSRPLRVDLGADPAASADPTNTADSASPPPSTILATPATLAGGTRDPVTLVLSDDAAPKIAIQVTTAAGAPVAGAFVFLEQQGLGQRLLTTGADGQATAGIEGAEPPAVRAAAYAGGLWALGAWTSWDAAQQGLALAIDAAGHGAIQVVSTRTGLLQLVSTDGWNLSWMLQELGAPPAAGSGAPAVRGLPAGAYAVSLGGAGPAQVVDVPADGSVEARLP